MPTGPPTGHFRTAWKVKGGECCSQSRSGVRLHWPSKSTTYIRPVKSSSSPTKTTRSSTPWQLLRFTKCVTPPNAPADPLATYRRKDGTSFYAVHPPQSGTDAKVRDWVKRYVPKDRQDQLSKSIDSLQNVLKQFDQAKAPNLEPILSDWGLSAAILAKCNVDAQIRLLAAIQLLRNWQFDFTTDQVSPPGVGGMIQFCTQQLSRSCRRKFEHFRQIAQSYILLLASLLQYSTQLPWQIQRTLLWSLSHWTVFGIYLNSWTQKCKRRMTYDNFFQHAQLPYRLTWTWWMQTSLVYMRVDLITADFYIGATEHSVFDREQSRVRKYRQLCNQQSAYFEPALKIWFHLNNLSIRLFSTAAYHFRSFECSWNRFSDYVPTSVQLAVDPIEEVPHWKAEIRSSIYQAVLGSESQVLSKISKTDTYGTNVSFRTQTSYVWSYVQLADSVGIGYNRKVSCIKIIKDYANGCQLFVFALATVSSPGGIFSYQKPITTQVDSSIQRNGTTTPQRPHAPTDSVRFNAWSN